VHALTEGPAGASSDGPRGGGGGVRDGAEGLRHGEVRDDQVVGASHGYGLRQAAQRRRRGLRLGPAGVRRATLRRICSIARSFFSQSSRVGFFLRSCRHVVGFSVLRLKSRPETSARFLCARLDSIACSSAA
jgi:hypothetical protein